MRFPLLTADAGPGVMAYQNEVAQIFGTACKDRECLVASGRVGLKTPMGLQCRFFPPYQIFSRVISATIFPGAL